MRNRRIVELRNYAKLELGKSGIGQFCAKWLLQMIAQIAVFIAQNWCATKDKFCVSFHKNCAKVLRMETLLPACRNAQVTCREATIENNQFSNLWTLI